MKSKQTIQKLQKTQKPHSSSYTENDSVKTLFSAKDQYPIPMVPIISQTSLKQLQQLYSKQNEQQNDTIEQTIGTLPSKTMEAHVIAAREELKKERVKAELSDVSIDE